MIIIKSRHAETHEKPKRKTREKNKLPICIKNECDKTRKQEQKTQNTNNLAYIKLGIRQYMLDVFLFCFPHYHYDFFVEQQYFNAIGSNSWPYRIDS